MNWELNPRPCKDKALYTCTHTPNGEQSISNTEQNNRHQRLICIGMTKLEIYEVSLIIGLV